MTPGNRQTEAAVLFELGKPLRLLTLSLPELAAGQVLVDVAYSGVCHTQVLEARGARGPDRFLPHTLGHEGSGTVLEVGPGVTKVKPGDRVVLSWIRGSGAHVPSVTHCSSVGPINSGPISTFMRRTVTCESRVTPIPPVMPLREAALLGCAIPTGAGIVFNTAQGREGQSVAIFGIGGVGMSAVLAAAFAGARPIIAVDVHEHKLQRALQLGATHLINASTESPLEVIQTLTGGRGVDFAIEAAGQREAMEVAFRSVCEKGGLLVIAGNLPHGETISIDPFDLIRGKRIVGTWGGESQPDRDVPAFANLYLSGRLPFAPLAGELYRLADINRALLDVEAGETARAMVDLSD